MARDGGRRGKRPIWKKRGPPHEGQGGPRGRPAFSRPQGGRPRGERRDKPRYWRHPEEGRLDGAPRDALRSDDRRRAGRPREERPPFEEPREDRQREDRRRDFRRPEDRPLEDRRRRGRKREDRPPERPRPEGRPPPRQAFRPDDRGRREHQPAPMGGAARDRPQVEGRRAVMEALRAGIEVRRLRVSSSVEPSPAMDAIMAEARARHALVEMTDPEALDAQSLTGRHQGVIAEVHLPPPLDLEQLLARTQAAKATPFFVVLDRVEDPQNLGAIARSAEAAGANGLILPERNAAHVSPGSLRASAGAILLLPVVVVPNIARCLEALKAKGIWVAGADPAGDKTYHQASLAGPVALVIGGESKGLHRLVRERCDFLVNVPLLGRVDSLNASAAAAVLLFEIARQRALGGSPPRTAQ